ncbi:hypothetical protein MIND_00621800 [Mycena indigotica]|uniref:Uncharacterized protein n=1 Tax=Mycena indigotica TaxID=2126181 RepID=A0A8H6SQF2_9AGAR|nr:uncharacterized protein MIND_00621800 [Mycena indigotica]KAF7303913.1 hypothetical protein MIND_00621800 [Mycena indigotica]
MSSPPSTTHALPQTQRIRLMRSTRKLAALLGAAPLLVDPSEPLPPFPRGPPKSASLPATPAAMSNDKLLLEPVVGAAESNGRPTLLLRISNAGISSKGHRRRASSASQSWGRPMSMMELGVGDLDDEEDEVEQTGAQSERRRKMARVARKLGDGVPIELVFPSELERHHSMDLKKARTSLDQSSAILPPTVFRSHTSSPSSSRPSTASTTSEPAMRPPNMRRTSSLLFKDKAAPRSATVRSELGWTGEWNQDETSVVKGLRALKQK